MAGSQRVFDFLGYPNRETLSPEAQRARLEALVARYGLDDLDLSTFRFRPVQMAAAECLLEGDDSEQIEAGTGSGKTGLFLLLALEALARGQRAILTTKLVHLVEQAGQAIDFFVKPDRVRYQLVSGSRMSKERRQRVYAAKPDILVVASRTLELDFANAAIWENVGLIVIDEPQLLQNRQGELPLAEKIRAEHPGIRCVAMSATLGASRDRHRALTASVGAKRKHHIPTPEELAAAAGTAVPEEDRADVDEAVFPIEISPPMRGLVQALLTQVGRCADEIRQVFATQTLWEAPPGELSLYVPPYPEREALRLRIEALADDDKRKPHLRSLIAELTKWCALWNRAACLGLHSFLELYAYRYAQCHYVPGLYLPELDTRGLDVDRRGVLSRADKNILGNEMVRDAIAPLILDTPFGLLLGLRGSIRPIVQSCEQWFAPLREEKVATGSARRRWNRLRQLNDRAGVRDTDVGLARRFFEYSLAFMARRELSDHAKIRAVVEQLELLKAIIGDACGYLFTAHSRHAEFLAEWFDARYDGIRPICITGRSGAKVRRDGLNSFRCGEHNILFTTEAWGGTGVDASLLTRDPAEQARNANLNPCIALFFAKPDSRADNFHQSRGRVVGRARGRAYVRCFGTAGTIEFKRYKSAVDLEEERRAAVVAGSAPIIPNFRV